MYRELGSVDKQDNRIHQGYCVFSPAWKLRARQRVPAVENAREWEGEAAGSRLSAEVLRLRLNLNLRWVVSREQTPSSGAGLFSSKP